MQESRMNNAVDNTSTPKRRRLGTGRILRPTNKHIMKSNISPIKLRTAALINASIKCESPPLPCNQIEFLCDSGNNTSSISNISCSPGVLNRSVGNIKNWNSFLTNEVKKPPKFKVDERSALEDIEDISDEMFLSRLEQEKTQDTQIKNDYRHNIEESFNAINQSICGVNTEDNSLDMGESFLNDLNQHSILVNTVQNKKESNNDSFYGLPNITRGLFKNFRNIEKLYDWQEECLNLDAIKERRNLIYALPTSGGKTLVAEILMLREVLNRKHNTLFILPFVAIVQEKIWSLSPFAVQLDFLIEEYAAGKGHMPPKKRRKKNSIYIATIEKGLALLRSLVELNRLQEIGLIVVDELHLIGEPGRGGALETLLTTVIFANKGIQIVGMSATIGNLDEIAQYLQADVFQREFRPVELTEYVKLGNILHKIVWRKEGMEVIPHRELKFDYSAAALSLDPDWLGGLVSEVVPAASCLVFCPTKKNAENVASLLCKLQRRDMVSHRQKEREALEQALRAEGASAELQRCVRVGVAFHHAGLAPDDRVLLEQAYRAGVISVICCTCTLAAGVNLPAQRVIVRAPQVGRALLSLAAYRQVVGRAGRTGLAATGESILICPARQWAEVQQMLSGGLTRVSSVLVDSEGGGGGRGGVCSLLMSALALRLVSSRTSLLGLLRTTLLNVTHGSEYDMKRLCDDSVVSLMKSGAIEVVGDNSKREGTAENCIKVYDDTEFTVSAIGQAAIKGCMELSVAKQMLQDFEVASRALVVMGSLHLLYLVTPHDAGGIRPDYRHYYTLYCALDGEGVQTARTVGLTESNAVRMAACKPITNVTELVLRRFYVALMLHDLWKELPFAEVADKYNVARGTVVSLMGSAASAAWSGTRLCEALPALWPLRALLAELAPRLQHCAAPELHRLMDLPNVKKARALQLLRAGYKRIEQVARACPDRLSSEIAHLSRTAASTLISAARMMLIEKVENLRAEAEDVMEELNL